MIEIKSIEIAAEDLSPEHLRKIIENAYVKQDKCKNMELWLNDVRILKRLSDFATFEAININNAISFEGIILGHFDSVPVRLISALKSNTISAVVS